MEALKAGALAKFMAYASVPIIEPTGRNDGPVYNKSQRLFDLKVGTATEQGDPTCAAIACMTFAISYAQAHGLDAEDESVLKQQVLPELRRIMPVSAGAIEMLQQAQDRFGSALHLSQWASVVPGDLIVYEFKPREHHIGMVRERIAGVTNSGLTVPQIVKTVEANTMPQSGVSGVESNDAARNGGIYRKERPFSARPGYRILGFIRTP